MTRRKLDCSKSSNYGYSAIARPCLIHLAVLSNVSIPLPVLLQVSRRFAGCGVADHVPKDIFVRIIHLFYFYFPTISPLGVPTAPASKSYLRCTNYRWRWRKTCVGENPTWNIEGPLYRMVEERESSSGEPWAWYVTLAGRCSWGHRWSCCGPGPSPRRPRWTCRVFGSQGAHHSAWPGMLGSRGGGRGGWRKFGTLK